MRRAHQTLRFMLATFLLFCLTACSRLGEMETPSPTPNPVRSGSFWLPGHDQPQTVLYQLKGSLAVMEGDIVLGRENRQTKKMQRANLLPSHEGRWPSGVVPYRIDVSVSAEGRRNIMVAIREWQDKTAFRFVVRRAQRDYVTFKHGAEAKACFSSVGRQGGEQFIYLSSSGSCSSRTLIHEVGHLVGLWHEHTRGDRDGWVRVVEQNILPGMAYNFERSGSMETRLGSYDYCSVMHYSAYTFSINGKPTLHLLKPYRCPRVVGWASSLSRGDVEAAKKLLQRSR